LLVGADYTVFPVLDKLVKQRFQNALGVSLVLAFLLLRLADAIVMRAEKSRIVLME
jgi:hypothetical protein